MASLTIDLLGAPQISLAGRPLELRVRKELALLAFLAAEQERPHRRDTLLALLWPELPDEAARNNLRVVLAGLRRLLGDAADAVLQIDRQQVRFRPGGEHRLDVAAFRELLAATAAHDHVALEACDLCVARLAEAAELYGGDFLAGFSLPDSAPFDEWATVQREQLHQQQLATLETLAVACELRGDHAGQVSYGRRLLALEPWREAGHDLLIRGLWSLGERGAALEQYAACRRILAEELGLEPSPELASLVGRLRAAAPAGPDLVPRAPAAPVRDAAPPVSAPAHNLPTALTPLVGRERELELLDALLRRPGIRMVTLTGPGGVGKTRLALELARRAVPIYPSVFLLQLAPLRQPEVVAGALLKILGVKPVGEQTPEEALAAWLRERRLLLLLDNCEHLLGVAPLVAELLIAAPGLVVLATSREPLQIYGEQRFPVVPLALPPERPATAERPEDLAQYAAVALFVQRLQAVRPTFALSAENAQAIIAICARLDGLPLALELAAARGQHLSPQGMLEQLRRDAGGLQLLASTGRDRSPRQQTLRAAIAWSYELLSAAEQRCFRRLAVFAGGWSEAAAEAIVGSGEELYALVEKSLVEADADGAPRFTMLETIREYAVEQLEACGESEALRQAHARYFLELAEAAEPHLIGGQEELGWWVQLRAEEDNMRAALRWAVDAGAHDLGLRLAGALWQFWDLGNASREGRGWLVTMLALVPPAAAPTSARAKALNGLAILALRQADVAAASAAAEASLACYRALGDARGTARAVLTLGTIAVLGQGDIPQAIAYYTEALELQRRLDHPTGLAVTLFNLGRVTLTLGDYVPACVWLDEALRCYEALGSRRWIARVQPYLAGALLMTGEHTRAATLLDQALTAWEQGVERDLMIVYQSVIGTVGLAAAYGELQLGALLLGGLDAIDAAVGTTILRAASRRSLYQNISKSIRARLGAAALAEAQASGRALSVDEVMAAARDVVAAVAARRNSTAQPGAGGNHLSAALMPLVGREQDLETLTARLGPLGTRLVSIVGLGGSGKTRLAIELGRSRLNHFADGVFFVPLAPLGAASSIAAAILAALGSAVASGDPRQTLLQELRAKHLLLILDNFEHVLDGASLVADILQSAPQVEILVTSRERLNLRDERPYFLQGLAYPRHATLAEAADAAAVRVFVQYAQRVQHAFSLNASDLDAVLQICHLVEGMPLGLELAAAMVEALSPAEIAAEIEQSVDILAVEWGDVPERQRSMRAVFDWSWRSLSDAERQVFKQLAVFRGGFTRQAAQAIVGASLPVLTRLVYKALLRVNGAQSGAGRYDQHELLRQYTLERLNETPGEHAALAERHASYYLDLAENVGPGASGGQHEAWLAQMEREHDNIRAALAWAEEQDTATFGLRLAAVVWPFWQRRCYLSEGRGWIERFLESTRGKAAPAAVRANALYGAGWLAHDQDDFASADAFFSEGLQLDRALGQTGRVAAVLAHRSVMARGQGQYAAAITLAEESLALARKSNDQAGIAYALFRLGLVTRERGDFARASAVYEECMAIYRALGDRGGAGFGLLGLADIARDQGDTACVHLHSTEALAIGRALEQHWITGFALNNLALAALLEGETARAATLADEALALFQTHGIRGGVVELLITRGQVATAAGSFEQARASLVEGVRHGWPAGPHWLVATGLEILAQSMEHAADTVRLFAATSSWRAAMGAPLPPYRRPACAAAVAAARRTLGNDRFAVTWAEGAAWQPAEAVAAVLGAALVGDALEAGVPQRHDLLRQH